MKKSSEELAAELAVLRPQMIRAQRRGRVSPELAAAYAALKGAHVDAVHREWVAARRERGAERRAWGRVVWGRRGVMGVRVYEPGAGFADPTRVGSVLENLGKTFDRGRGPWRR